MAWSIPTYAAHYMGGEPSAARVALFELCRAVNERQGAVGITKTQFYKANGTQGSDVASADFAKIKASGTNSLALRNMKRIRDAVVAMADSGKFTQASGRSSIMTKAALETIIGADVDADPIRPQEARFWQAMQDALDALIYAKVETLYATGDSTQTLSEFIAHDTTRALTWDEMLTYGDITDPAPYSTAGVGFFSSYSGPNYNVRRFSKVEDLKFVNTYQGVLQALDYRTGVSVYSGLTESALFWIGSSSTIDVLDYVGSSGAEVILPAASLDLSLNSTDYVDEEIEIPATNPFGSGGIDNRSVSVGWPVYAQFYIDIESLLTDQA